jgi:hypothetical protein
MVLVSLLEILMSKYWKLLLSVVCASVLVSEVVAPIFKQLNSSKTNVIALFSYDHINVHIFVSNSQTSVGWYPPGRVKFKG